MIKNIVKNLKPSSTLKINELCKDLESQGKEIFKFGFGQSPFKVPEDVKFAKIDRHNATIPGPNSLKKDIIYEAFKSENYDEFIKQQKQIKSAPEEDNTEGLQYESEIY